jgi:hypothetical protein
MPSGPDIPPPARGGVPRYQASSPPGTAASGSGRRLAVPFQPARYVHGLLLAQGLAWLVLAGAALTAWVLTFPASVNLVSAGGAALWTGAELLGIVVGTCLGAAEVAMACRMRGGQPRLLLGLTVAIQGTMVAVALILAAFLVTVGGSLLQLLALGGLPGPARPVRLSRAGSAGRAQPGALSGGAGGISRPGRHCPWSRPGC